MGPFSVSNGSIPKQNLTGNPWQKTQTLIWHTKVGSCCLVYPYEPWGKSPNMPTVHLNRPNLMIKDRSNICLTLSFYNFLQRFNNKFGN